MHPCIYHDHSTTARYMHRVPVFAYRSAAACTHAVQQPRLSHRPVWHGQRAHAPAACSTTPRHTALQCRGPAGPRDAALLR